MLSRVISLSLFLFSTYIWVQGQASAPAPSLSQEAFILEYWYESSFPTYAALTDGTLEISLPKSRDIKLKSPERKYETREDGERRIYLWTVKNFVPNRSKRQNDEELESDQPDVQLSSFTDWQKI